MLRSSFILLFFFAALHFLPIHAQVSHDVWNTLLQKHVDSEGWVDYKGFQRDRAMLDKYLAQLSAQAPQSSWTRESQMAYWINAYNAFTTKLILDHYPVQSIQDLSSKFPNAPSVWKAPFIKIQGITYSLDQIENEILRRQFRDARIHAAVNCASYSCPRLWREAFVPSQLDQQLEAAMKGFVNDPLRNQVKEGAAAISQLFNWYAEDFVREAGSVAAYLNKYAKVPLSAKAKITYLEYNWKLNEKK